MKDEEEGSEERGAKSVEREELDTDWTDGTDGNGFWDFRFWILDFGVKRKRPGWGDEGMKDEEEERGAWSVERGA